MERSLKMDRPVEHSLLDRTNQNIISRPIDRYEGPLKVSGKAIYSAEFDFEGLAHGVLVGAPFGKGTITSIDTSAAEAQPGVISVVAGHDKFIRYPAQGMAGQAPEQGVRDIVYFGQPVALVVAGTFEQARHAAGLLDISYDTEEGRYDFRAHLAEAEETDSDNPMDQGDLDKAMADATVTIDRTYTTPSQTSAPMEPHASIAVWKEGKLTLFGSYQMLAYGRTELADALGMKRDDVRMVAHYVGGGFGSKLGIAPESVAAALAARELGRPVKVVMTRQQVFETTVRRPETVQHVRLAADKDGRLTGIGHETICDNLPGEDQIEPAGMATHFLYSGQNRKISHKIVRVNKLLGGSMRAPGEAVGMLALESAMDELAEKLDIDPIELRRRNEPEQDPEKNIPYSTRSLVACMEAGARHFGWNQRKSKPASTREGDWWIGHGMAAAARGNMLIKSSARVTLQPDGRAIVETDMTDIGTGSYTILAQITAELLGLTVDAIDVRLGDTDFPPASGSGGSFGAASSGTSVYLACQAIRDDLARRLQVPVEELTLTEGSARAGNQVKTFAELLDAPLTETGTVEPGDAEETFQQAGYGAHFAEVAVNAYSGEVRVRRMSSTFAAGRILNHKTARSQCLGGMVFGIGAALTEELIHDTRYGNVVNRDLAEYHLPVNADVPQLEVTFLDERDHAANPLLAKGIGELGISGAGAAVANAIYNACGVRVREFPITLDKIIDKLPPV